MKNLAIGLCLFLFSSSVLGNYYDPADPAPEGGSSLTAITEALIAASSSSSSSSSSLAATSTSSAFSVSSVAASPQAPSYANYYGYSYDSGYSGTGKVNAASSIGLDWGVLLAMGAVCFEPQIRGASEYLAEGVFSGLSWLSSQLSSSKQRLLRGKKD